jgi:ATP synthase protein I
MSGDGTNDNRDQNHGQISPRDREAIRQRSSEIGSKLDAINARKSKTALDEDRQRGAAFGRAFQFAAELVVGVGVGGFIGWLLDGQFGTKPWLLLLFGFFGFAAGFLNLVRAAKKAQAENAAQGPIPSVPDDDDET